MKKLFYPLYALPIYAIVLLPFFVYYGFSNLLFVIGYYLIGYRKDVIFTNLKNAFPHYSENQIRTIAQHYFRYMIDLFLETFKLLVMSAHEVEKRMVFTNLEVLQPYVDTNQSVLFVLGHYGNWEWWGQSFQLKRLMQKDALYHPLSNGFFDWLTLKQRSRFGVHLIPMNVSIKEMIKRKNLLTATAFISDQTPSNLESSHWMTFLNQDTPVFLGTEKIAKKLNRPVIFAHIYCKNRGYYEARFTVITNNPQGTPDGWITEQHTRLLEVDILQQPQFWLWSHRRWKHKRKH